jgi:hypothetical protein
VNFTGRRSRTLAGCALLLALATAGCGYKFVRPPGAAAGGGQPLRVAVPPLQNDSFEQGIDVLLTDALRREFLRRGGVKLVDRSATADVVVEGRIHPLETFVTSVSSVAAALEQQVEVEVDLRAKRGDGSEIPLSSTSFVEWELYLESADVQAARKNRDEALRRVASVIATRFHEVLAAGLRP